MDEIKSRLKSVTDKNMWVARRAAFLAKAKATKMVWFPPKPEQAGDRTAATVAQTTKNTANQTTAAANRATD